jgi:hypothetical protein
MSGRKWTSSQRTERSESITEIQPWQQSTGPRSMIGKNRSKMNAVTHGIDTEILREIRKSTRRPEVIELETLCKELIKQVKSGDPEKMQPLTDQLDDKFRKLSVDYDKKEISPEMQMESQYTTILMLKTINFAIHKGAMKLCTSIFERW